MRHDLDSTMSSDIQLERLLAERTADKATIAALTAEVARLESDASVLIAAAFEKMNAVSKRNETVFL
jgi:cell division protein FtsB